MANEDVLQQFEKDIINSQNETTATIKVEGSSDVTGTVSLTNINLKKNENIIQSDNSLLSTELSSISRAIKSTLNDSQFKKEFYESTSKVPTIENTIVEDAIKGSNELCERLSNLLNVFSQVGEQFSEIDYKLASEAEDINQRFVQEVSPAINVSRPQNSGTVINKGPEELISAANKEGEPIGSTDATQKDVVVSTNNKAGDSTQKVSTSYSYYMGEDVQEDPKNKVVEDKAIQYKDDSVKDFGPEIAGPEELTEPTEPVIPHEVEPAPETGDLNDGNDGSTALRNAAIMGGVGAAVGAGAFVAHSLVSNRIADKDYKYEYEGNKGPNIEYRVSYEDKPLDDPSTFAEQYENKPENDFSSFEEKYSDGGDDNDFN